MQVPVLFGPDTAAAAAVSARIDELTKPQGSLGALERLAIRLAAIAPLPLAGFRHRQVLIATADHGVAAEGVSAYPAEVTTQMVGAFVRGTAACNAFARTMQASITIANFGTATPLPTDPRVLDLPVAAGTANLATGPAMTVAQAEQAISAGMQAIEIMIARGPLEILALGEMGIGNTTSAAALICALTGAPAPLVVGRGTGIDDDRLARKVHIIESVMKRCAPLCVFDQIAAVGGFEILGLAGAMMKCAQLRIPVVLDGVIVAAAALVADVLAPHARTVMIASHRSVEPGHAFALEQLDLTPLFSLDLRLGEATGAILAFGLCDAAARMVSEMQTFAEAGVALAHETVVS